MEQIYDSLRSLIKPEMVSKASKMLDEKESGISSAVSSIVAGILGVMLKKGNVPQLRNILEEGGNLHFASGDGSLDDQQRIGDDFLQHLLGDKAADFSDPIADDSNISKVATNRLVSMIAPLVVGYLGNKLVNENWSMPHLLNEIGKQKDSFKKYLPAGLIGNFGLSSVLNKTEKTVVPEKKKSNSWIIWLILVALVVLLFFVWRSCGNTNSEGYQGNSSNDTILQRVDITEIEAEEARYPTDAMGRDTARLTLPDGTIITVYKGGVEEQMLNYLKSGDYKNATEDQLKEKWFNFDNIAFEFNSATELKSGSEQQLGNIAAILKNYKDAKIRVAGFADKVGTESANMEISKERAKKVEQLLEERGAGSQIVKTEGFGDEYAKHSASESNDARSSDRDIALRFVKK